MINNPSPQPTVVAYPLSEASRMALYGAWDRPRHSFWEDPVMDEYC